MKRRNLEKLKSLASKYERIANYKELMKIRNKKQFILDILKEKNLNCDVKYVSKKHAWHITYPDGLEDNLGSFPATLYILWCGNIFNDEKWLEQMRKYFPTKQV